MSLQFYNTLTRRKEPFEPLEKGKVRMYSCGPTVYQTPSIGNYRAFLLSDLIRRHLQHSGYEVKQVMNITDVGHVTLDADMGTDKLQEAAAKEGKDPWKIALHYEEIFKKDLKTLGCREAFKYPRATEHISEMLEMIKQLISKGLAYEVRGNVYFDVGRFPDYGKLSNNTLDQLVAGARVEVHPDKKHPADFALWKQDPKHVMQWDSPWGKGFPGWHIECSAMSRKYLGDRFDIHTGGEDLVFPHHECEIAQSEGSTGKTPVVRYWLHNSFLLIDGGKMSKSLGNVVLVQNVLDQGFKGRHLRFALIRVHYRTPLNFTWAGMLDAASALDRIDNFVDQLHQAKSGEPLEAHDLAQVKKWIVAARQKFQESMDDDLNVSEALAAVFDLVNMMYDLNRKFGRPWSPQAAIEVERFFDEVNQVLGILDLEQGEVQNTDAHVLLQLREQKRKEKDWKGADAIRKEIEALGFEVVDSATGSRLKKK